MSSDILAEARKALEGLKDFQRETVEHVHRQLFAPEASRRFLVADEVGLGKTMIARGVVARAIEVLHDKVDRVDVVYVCSNAEIARQNIRRLKFDGGYDRAMDTRLTLLPRHVAAMKKAKSRLNFVAFTPATSFDLKDGLGLKDERALLMHMLQHIWKQGRRTSAMNVMMGNSGVDSFRALVEATSLEEVDPEFGSTNALRAAIEAHDAKQPRPELTLRATFERLCEAYPRYDSKVSREVSEERSRFVGQLRALLAASCLSSLKPDIVILDEFQRFAHLLDPNEGDAQLAQELFSVADVRVLLLSATPYRMFTPPGEEAGEDHYEDFVRTVSFLERGTQEASLQALLRDYREAMLELGLTKSSARLVVAARALEARLRRVMVRTERLGATTDRNGMLTEVHAGQAPVKKEDALGYVAMSRIARAVLHHDPVEYWKSAPYLLNFMESEYALTRGLETVRSDAEARHEVARALAMPGHHRFDVARLKRHEALDPGNGRLRQLVDQTIGRGAHRLLWLPPSLAYYRLGGAHAEPGLRGYTKRLVFSSWRFVPRAIAGFLSYEAERLMLGGAKRKSNAGLLRFSTADGRPTGMPVLALMYPSSYLARDCDPLRLAREVTGETSSGEVPAEAVLEMAREQVGFALERLPRGADDGPVDQRWYWAAPLLLDQSLDPAATVSWFDNPDLAGAWSTAGEGQDDDAAPEVDAGWEGHVEHARAMLASRGVDLGRRPDDLGEVLAELAIGGPGPCLLRSMLRVVGMKTSQLNEKAGLSIRTAAASAAWAFRALFNQPEVTLLLQREAATPSVDTDESYWRLVLRYGVSGCLQAVLDEYAHVLRLSAANETSDERVHEIALQMRNALSLRSANLTVRDFRPSDGGRTVEEGEGARVRSHFAVRYGNQKSDDGASARADLVRQAFNSPFWPFVLATTSVGQEGLDFHPYCHAVVHWNLPTNPVDLEQREGRVHRYKGHAVRKNVAQRYFQDVVMGDGIDAWEELFRIANERKPPNSTDIVPYWVFGDGDARIERHVLALPSSREMELVHRLLKALTLYRMVFGQPRQEDMLRFLRDHVPDAELQELLSDTSICLAPPAAG